MRYWSETIQLGDGEQQNSGWVHALPVTRFKHPIHGVVEITRERIKKFADNINNKVRGTDLDIDYDHKRVDGKAAGWVKSAEERDDGLWLLVEWTDDAAEEIRKKKWRYFSSEFVSKWKHPQEDKEYEDVFLGGGLTNRPFLKDLVPVNLSELMEESPMDKELREALIKRFSLGDDATDEHILEAAKTESKKVDLSEATVEKQEDGTFKITHQLAEGSAVVTAETKQDDDDDDLTKLAEDHPAIAKMIERDKQRDEDIKRLKTANRLATVNTKLGELDKLPPVVKDKFRDALVRLPVTLSDELTDALVKLNEVGLVDTQQHKPSGSGSTSKNAVTRFNEEIDKHMQENEGVSYADAVEAVAEAQPQLYEEYERGIMLSDDELVED